MNVPTGSLFALPPHEQLSEHLPVGAAIHDTDTDMGEPGIENVGLVAGRVGLGGGGVGRAGAACLVGHPERTTVIQYAALTPLCKPALS